LFHPTVRLRDWAERFEERTWAVESAHGLGYLLAQQLVAAGEDVIDVPPVRASRVRVLGSAALITDSIETNGVVFFHRKPREVEQPMSTYVEPPTRRPGVVSFIGIILYIQAALAVVAAISLLIWRNDILNFLEKEGSPLSDGAFTGTILGEVIVAMLLFAVASGIMRGSNGYRLFVAIVQGLNMGLAVYVLIAHHVGGYVYRGVFTLFVGVFVLWALYGNAESDEYFATNG
jgi:hypothetical protein